MVSFLPIRDIMPPKDYDSVDIDKLRAFCRQKPTLLDCAAFFGVSDRTIERVCRKHEKMTFVEFRAKYMVHTRHALIRKAIKMAESGNVAMLIFCLKNLCGWTDKQEISTEDSKPIELKYKV